MGKDDLELQMKFCGCCHSDLHNAAGQVKIMGETKYPIVPGHELCGIVVAAGENVTGFAVGDAVGIGCIVDSCLACKQCKDGNEHKCLNGMTGTYNAGDKHGRAAVFPPGSQTLGGYSTRMVINKHFAIKVPKTYPLEMVGPVMCAGVTMYSPLMNFGVTHGTRVGIVGLGGLGQMGVSIAKAMGAVVTVISTNSSKTELATRCGATGFVVSADSKQMKDAAGSLDLILNTVPTHHNYAQYNRLLDFKAKKAYQVILGLHAGLAAALILDAVTGGNSRIKMSGIGSIKETQEVIDLCDKNKIYPEIAVVPVTQLNDVYTKLDASNQSGVRYVLDISTLKPDVICDAPPPILGKDSTNMTLGAGLWDCCSLFFCCKWY